MWQRFTERARRLVFFAQEEAGRLGDNYVSTEHLLLGMCRDEDFVSAKILAQLGVSLQQVREEVERRVSRGDGRLGQDMQLTPRAKRAIDLAYDEARQLNSSYIGTEHILLGLLKEGEGLAARVLSKFGIGLDRARKEVITLQGDDAGTTTGTSTARGDFSMTGPPLRTVASDELGLKGCSLLSMVDLAPKQISGILAFAEGLEFAHKRRSPSVLWHYPRSLAMIFEKPSLRTRVTFDLGMQQLGGLAVVLGPSEIGLGIRESIPDVARNLERWVDCIMARVFEHHKLETLRDNCKIPIINGLSDREHPCQALADLYTIQQKKGTLEGLKLAWVGDGNNVLHSLLLGCALTGMSLSAACPKGYEPLSKIVEQAKVLAEKSKIENRKSEIEVVVDPAEAVSNADVVYTDVWTSMGHEEEQLARIQAFRSYQVNAELIAKAKPDAIFMHCLPAHRGDEVTDEVVDGRQSVVFDQAENRLHVQKAILALLIGS